MKLKTLKDIEVNKEIAKEFVKELENLDFSETGIGIALAWLYDVFIETKENG